MAGVPVVHPNTSDCDVEDDTADEAPDENHMPDGK
jgi:hypothetical protein